MPRFCTATLALILTLTFSAWANEAATTTAAQKAAAFLLTTQNADGTFGKSKGAIMPGMVGVVVKALANSPDKYRDNNVQIAKAVKYMLDNQQPNGSIALADFGLENYNTSCAVIALAALENPAHKDALEKAKKFILECQLVEGAGYSKDEHIRAYGGFGYGNSKRPDVSNSSFSMEALKALGLSEDSPAWKNAIIFLKRCQDNDETNDAPDMKGGDNTGGFAYTPHDSEFGTIKTKSGKTVPKPYGNMTYAAIKCLIFAKISKDDPTLQAAYRWVKNNYAVDQQPGSKDNQGYYYYVVSFAKAFSAMGVKEFELADGRKVNWAKDLSSHLISLQKPDGSFVNPANRWMEDEPALCTAYALQALNLCNTALK